MTFTVGARDAATGMLGIAQSAHPITVGSRCPFIRSNVGAVSMQPYTDPGLGPLAIELLSLGHAPQEVIAELRESDPHIDYRQIGIVDRHGRVCAFSGAQCKTHTSVLSGPDHVVLGNLLAADRVVPEMQRAWFASEGALFEDRLLAMVVAGRHEGGDTLSELMGRGRPLIGFYAKRPHEPGMIGWMDWLKERGTPFVD